MDNEQNNNPEIDPDGPNRNEEDDPMIPQLTQKTED